MSSSGDIGPTEPPAAKIKLDHPAEIEAAREKAVEAEIELNVHASDNSASQTGSLDTGLPLPSRIRALIAEDPELLEAGFRIYADKKGKLVGVNLDTPVGSIDLLVQDSKGAFAVVQVSEKDGEVELVAGLLQRIGWVQKHLAGRKQTVRGLILVQRAPDSLIYAAAALPKNLEIRVYRMALSFDLVEV